MMSRFLAMIKGISLGAGCMYLFDPDRGRARRARLRDKFIHLQHAVEREVEVGLRDLNNRLYGLSLACGDKLAARGDEHTSDETLVARVRSHMGHVVSHAHALGVAADEGRVTLSGPILASEVEPLLCAVRSVPGVAEVRNNLDIHETPGDISALQGSPSASNAACTWTPATRLLVGAGSCLALLHGVVNRNRFCSLLGTVGLGVVAAQVNRRPGGVLYRKATHNGAPQNSQQNQRETVGMG